MSNYLFISKMYPDTLLPKFQKATKTGLDFAAHNLSKAIWTGFRENGIEVDVLNTPQLGSWPFFHKTPFISGCREEHVESVPYFNAMYFKRSCLQRKVEKKVLEWCGKCVGSKYILLYNFNYIDIAQKVKNRYEDVKICLLVTDLPEYMATDSNLFTSIINSTNRYQKDKYADRYSAIDGLVLLAEPMKERLPIGGKPWIQVEGIFNNDNVVPDMAKAQKKTILYTGNLGKRYGICKLMEAFAQIHDDNYELQICGAGDGLEEVKKYAEEDARIKYLGILPRLEVQKLQKAATVLVNPRNSNDEYTIYSFPSKTMEYLASGTPTLMSHLKCIPAEYDKFIFYLDEDTVDGLAAKLQQVCNIPLEERNAFGKAAAEFIINTKTPKPQVKKIIDFFETL